MIFKTKSDRLFAPRIAMKKRYI